MAHKKDVKRRMATPSMFGDDPPPGGLRAVKVIPNSAAQQEGFFIPTNMQVPAASVIRRLFDGEPQTDGVAGSGIDKIRQGWASQKWRWPLMLEEHRLDRVRLILPMISLMPEESLVRLRAALAKVWPY